MEGAAPIRLPATVLHREIKEMGYDGTDRRFLATLTPPPAPEPVVRFETAPGHQAQMDWGEYRLGGRKVYAFVGVLGFSRWLYAEYTDSMKSEVLMACHQRMLAAFGGVPSDILYDNMKTVVIKRNAYGPGKHRFGDDLWALAKRCRFRPTLAYSTPFRSPLQSDRNAVESMTGLAWNQRPECRGIGDRNGVEYAFDAGQEAQVSRTTGMCESGVR